MPMLNTGASKSMNNGTCYYLWTQPIASNWCQLLMAWQPENDPEGVLQIVQSQFREASMYHSYNPDGTIHATSVTWIKAFQGTTRPSLNEMFEEFREHFEFQD